MNILFVNAQHLVVTFHINGDFIEKKSYSLC